ncbi:MAG: M48 family metallopeptidase [Terriglobales bacterium]
MPAAEPPSPGASPEATTTTDPSAAGAYSSAHLRLSLASTGVDLAALAIFVFSGASLGLVHGLGRWQWMDWTRHSEWALVFAYTLLFGCGLELLSLPFALASRRLEMRFGLNRQTWRGWCADRGKSTGLAAGLGLLAAELVYALLRAAPAEWWLWAWAGFLAFLLLLTQLAPVVLFPLFYRFRPLSPDRPAEADLITRLQALCARAGTRVRGVFEWQLGDKTSKANAALAGWGATRRILVSDTLMADAPAEEIEAVLAHELGHHVHRHIWRGLAVQAGISGLGFWVANRVLVALAHNLHLSGIADVAGLPLLLLVAAVLGVVLLPLGNAFSRHMERQADDYSLAAMGRPDPLIAGLERLARRNLAEVEPPRWKEVLFYSHPAIATRIRRLRAAPIPGVTGAAPNR